MPDELHAIVNPDGFDMEEFELYVSNGGLPASGARAMRDEFSVYWWDAEGNQHDELRFVGAGLAVKAMQRLRGAGGADWHDPALYHHRWRRLL